MSSGAMKAPSPWREVPADRRPRTSGRVAFENGRTDACTEDFLQGVRAAHQIASFNVEEW